MPSPKASLSQAEIRRYLRAMREAGIDEGQLEIAKPDGTTIKIIAGRAGDVADEGDEIDDMIEKVPNP